MKLFLITRTNDHPACRDLTERLDALELPFRIVSSRSELQEILAKVCTEEALFIYLSLNLKDLEELKTLRPMFQDRKIITILPDDSDYSQAIGCSVLPRFQALLTDDLSIVAEIACRIIKHAGR